jgi:uncharacterized membrane protein
MTKATFLSDLRKALEEASLPKKEIEDTLQEYASMIDDAIESGQTIEAFSKTMGSPKKVAKALSKDRPYGKRESSNRLVSLSPFLSTIAFFFLGVFADAWHPGWLVYLSIPILGILTSKKVEWKGLFVFLTVIVLILGGTYSNLWNPLWSLFLLLSPFTNNKEKTKYRPLAIGYTSLVVMFYHGVILGYSLGYLDVGSTDVPLWTTLLLLLFIPVIGYGFWVGSIQIRIRWMKDGKSWITSLANLLLVLSIVIGYVVLGIVTGLWHPGWLLFLLIPIYFTSVAAKTFPINDLMPFIATILFVLVGEYVHIPGETNSYALSWLFYLLIPITGILKEKGE